MPSYKSHKEVTAVKITSIEKLQDGSAIISADEQENFIVSSEYVNKHDPHVGGYWVKYDDGYESFSPAEAFESGYTRIG